MKKIIEAAINKGGYDLETMLKKIDTYHIEGKLSDADREDLYSLARKSPEAQYDYKAEINRLWAEIRALRKLIETPNADSDTDTSPADEYPEFVQPTGAHDAYHEGAKVTFDGKRYVSKIDNNVWSPSVYPDGWVEVNDSGETEGNESEVSA